ncbi:major capsid protein [Haloterrigena salifodinae]|uniref:major capsid protein n=1 Tax=Haloterrigena salifodinae TaxID=2675099 RepID=UPI000F85D0BC|nr:major capsid protein [Haloterrigena salifodinae]
MATSETYVSTHSEFQDEAEDEHITAFFNPFKDARERALKEIRAKSGHSPEMWEQLDIQAGIKQPEGKEEITADSPYGYQSGIEFGDEVLNEQFVQSTIIDTLLGAGFNIPSSLANYVYATSLQAGRMEADVSMNPRSRSRQDRTRSGVDAVAQPVVHVDYELDGREMEVRRAHGEEPETDQAREARRAINRREAHVLFNGWGGTWEMEDFGSVSVTGLNSDTSQIIQTGSTGAGWDDAQVVLDDFDHLHDQIEDQEDVEDTDDVPLVDQVGGYLLVPRQQWGNVTRQDYQPDSGAVDEPLIDRIERKYPYINVLPAPRLAGDTAIFLLNDPRYFGIVNAQGMTNTAWDIDGGHARRHKLVASRMPFVRRQPDGIRGIVRMTGI